MTNDAKKTGERIRALMRQRGVTQHELAEATGISQSTLSMAIHGVRRWHMDKLQQVARALGVSVVELLGGEEPSKNSSRVCVEFSPEELQRLEGFATKELRTVDNYVRWLVLRSIQPKDESSV